MVGTYVFLHGSPGRASLWDSLIALAPAEAKCVAFDLLDHGESQAPGVTTDDVLADVVRRVRALEAPVTLVGHSFGAWIGGRALAELGGRVARYVAIGGLAGMGADLAARSQGFADALRAGQLTREAGVEVAAELWLPSGARRRKDEDRIAKLILGDSVERLARVLELQTQIADPARRVGAYDVPATCIHQTGDRAVPVALGRELASMGSRARMLELEGDGHYPHWTDAERVAAAIFGGAR